jgi:hypothetical protein
MYIVIWAHTLVITGYHVLDGIARGQGIAVIGKLEDLSGMADADRVKLRWAITGWILANSEARQQEEKE